PIPSLDSLLARFDLEKLIESGVDEEAPQECQINQVGYHTETPWSIRLMLEVPSLSHSSLHSEPSIISSTALSEAPSGASSSCDLMPFCGPVAALSVSLFLALLPEPSHPQSSMPEK
ncbi:hypothetical protein KUCAC02_035829, partial [Chaenocephalus aceratus]